MPPSDFGVEDNQLLVPLVSISGVPCELLTDVFSISGEIEVNPGIFTDTDVNNPRAFYQPSRNPQLSPFYKS